MPKKPSGWTTTPPTRAGWYLTRLVDDPTTLNLCKIFLTGYGWSFAFPERPAGSLSILTRPRQWYGPLDVPD